MIRSTRTFRSRRAAWWALLALCLQTASCYSYTGRLHVVPGSRATATDGSARTGYSDSDLDAARKITRQVALRFEMEEGDSEIFDAARETSQRFERHYELLAYYSRHDESAPTRAARARINIGVDARDDRSELIFWIRDLDHGGETDFTRAIRAELERLVRKRFDGSYIRYEQFKISTFMSG